MRTVYNLEVEEDHSYTADGVAVHNCWLMGESFVKVSGNEKDEYGKLYRKRKEYESAKNERGEYAELARLRIEKGKTARVKMEPGLLAIFESGKLPAAALHERSKRWAVKLFLAHWHEAAYKLHYGVPAPLPYPIAHLGHVHKIESRTR